jgi:hypothetical protein
MCRPIPACVLGVAVSLAATCGVSDVEADATPATPVAVASSNQALTPTGALRVLGTITATLSGTERTWHVVAGPSRGRAFSSGVWVESAMGRRTLAIGGFDTPTPPLDSFEWDENGMPTSYGSYPGSTIRINLTVSQTPVPFTLMYPPEETPAVMYTTRTTRNPLFYTFGISQGVVDVTSVSIDDGLASAAGTFTGRLKIMRGEGTLEVTDGVFAVAGVPSATTLR